MACPVPARLAAAVSGEDADALAHAAECARCAATVDEQRELVTAARAMARLSIPLSEPRRRAIAAEVMAQSDALGLRGSTRRRVPIVVAAGVLAAAAAALVIFQGLDKGADAPVFSVAATEEQPATSDVRTSQPEAAAPNDMRRPAELVTRDADFVREQRDWADVITLRNGELSIDARDREPVTIVAGKTRVRIAKARVTVVVRNRMIVTTHVFAGSAEVTHGRRREVIVAGDLWTPPAKRTEPTSPTASLEAFRAGWQALRAQKFADAIAAFDRATDPVVVEDAMFWAAIANERAGNLHDAEVRLRAFLERFPSSPRAEDARGAIERVSP